MTGSRVTDLSAAPSAPPSEHPEGAQRQLDGDRGTRPSLIETIHRGGHDQGLGLRPPRFHLARPGVADLVARPLEDGPPMRSPELDLDRGRYTPIPDWEAAVYQLRSGAHRQLGLLLEARVADYDAGRIRPHESTRASAVASLAGHLQRTGVDIAPVTLAHAADAEVTATLADLARSRPALDAVTADGVQHSIWLVDTAAVAPLLDRLSASAVLYVVDGHHRCAAGSLLVARRRPAHDDPAAHLFAFVVSQDQLTVASFHVLVHDVDAGAEASVRAIADHLGVAPREVDERTAAATAAGAAAMWTGQRWYRFALGGDGTRGDAELLHQRILGPVFAITDPDQDRRLGHLPGTTPLTSVREACPPGSVAFILHPPTVASWFAAADARRSVPPKSSYFHPKVPAGLVVRCRR